MEIEYKEGFILSEVKASKSVGYAQPCTLKSKKKIYSQVVTV